MSKTITLRPRISEQTYALSTRRVYVFEVERAVNKHDIARAVEAQFEVKVVEVNTANLSGKAKRIISLTGKRMRNAEGKRPDVKKAYVTLAEGNSLPFFEAVAEAEAAEAKAAEKAEKAEDKQANDEAKPARRGLRRAKKEDK